MADKTSTRYDPDYLVLPGEVLEEYLEAFSMTQAELAARTGLAKKTINEGLALRLLKKPVKLMDLNRTISDNLAACA